MNKVYKKVLLDFLERKNDWVSINEIVKNTLITRITIAKYLNILYDENKIEDKRIQIHPTKRITAWHYKIKRLKDKSCKTCMYQNEDNYFFDNPCESCKKINGKMSNYRLGGYNNLVPLVLAAI